VTKSLIEAVLERVRTWPVSRQEDAALMLLAMEAQESSLYALSEEERVDIEAAIAEVERCEVATDDEVSAVFNRHRK
jgi:hypothetical protein